MKKTVIFILTLINLTALAQESSSQWKLNSKSDTSFWYSYHQEKLEYFDFPKVADVKSDLVFRFWRPFSYLEITDSADQLIGNLTFFVIEETDTKDHHDTFVKRYKLPDEVVNNLDSLLTSNQFDRLPSDKFILGWEHGFDGITYLFEGRKELNWYFKHYWTPTTQKDIDEATFLINLMTDIDNTIDYSNYLDLFSNANPFTSYKYYGASYSVVKILTKKERKKIKSDSKHNER